MNQDLFVNQVLYLTTWFRIVLLALSTEARILLACAL